MKGPVTAKSALAATSAGPSARSCAPSWATRTLRVNTRQFTAKRLTAALPSRPSPEAAPEVTVDAAASDQSPFQLDWRARSRSVRVEIGTQG
jgi:hypothetical protein